jgi:hypothetical protein
VEFRHGFHSLRNLKRRRYSINKTLPHSKNSHHPSGLLLRRAAHFISQHPESERPSQTCRWRSRFAGLTKRIESEGRAPVWLGLRQSFADRYVSSTANTTEAVCPSSASRFGFLTSSCHGIRSMCYNDVFIGVQVDPCRSARSRATKMFGGLSHQPHLSQ